MFERLLSIWRNLDTQNSDNLRILTEPRLNNTFRRFALKCKLNYVMIRLMYIRGYVLFSHFSFDITNEIL